MERKDASNTIEAAVNSVISEDEDWEEGDILVEWVLVAYVANPDKEKGSSYPMYYSNGEMATHRARGLLITGLGYLDKTID